MKRRNSKDNKGPSPIRKRAWWRNRRSLLYFGVSSFLVSLVIGAGCAGTKPAKPYRGTLLKTITIKKELSDAWAKKKFDPSGNCVQMVARDKTEDGVRKVEKLLMFSPDPCAGGNQVNERESFVLPFVESSTFSDQAKLPTLAYHVVKGDYVVGRVDLLARSSGGSNPPPPNATAVGPIAANAAASFESDTYELADLCTFDTHFRQNCEIEFTVDGKFSQATTARAAVGRMEREKALLQTILSRIDQSEISLRGALNEVQQNLINYTRDSVKAAESRILANQNMAAILTLRYLHFRLQRLELNVQNHATNEISQLRADLMTRIDEMQTALTRKIETEVAEATRQLREEMKGMSLDFGIRMGALNRSIVDLQKRLDTMENNIKASQWEAAWATVEFIWMRLNFLESNLTQGQEKLATAVTNMKLLLERYSLELSGALGDEAQRASARFVVSLVAMETRLDGKASALRASLQGQLTALSDSLKSSQSATVRAILEPLRDQLAKFEAVAGARLTDSERQELVLLRDVLTRLNGEIVQRLRRELLVAARLARVAIAGNAQRLQATATDDEKALFRGAAEKFTRLETAFADSQAEAAWIVLSQLEKDVDAFQGAVFQKLDPNGRYRTLDLARAIREYVGQLAAELQSDIGQTASRLAARFQPAPAGLPAPLAKTVADHVTGLDVTLKSISWEEGWQTIQIVDFLLADSQAKLGNAPANARLAGEIEGVRSLIHAFQTATLRSFDGYGPLGATLEALAGTADASLATLRTQIATALRDGSSLAPAAVDLRAEVQRLLSLPASSYSVTTRRNLVIIDLALGRLLVANQPRVRSLRGAAILHDVLGRQPIRASNRMMALIGQMNEKLGAVTSAIAAGQLAQMDTALTAVAQHVTTDEFNTEVVENWLAARADMIRLYAGIDDLRGGLH